MPGRPGSVTVRIMRLGLPLLLLAGCATEIQLQPDRIADRLGAWVPGPTATILQSQESGLHAPTIALVADTGAWRALWVKTWAGTPVLPPLPNIDFVLSSVLIVGLGDRAGLGYAVTIDSVVSYSSGPVLYATTTQPGSQCQFSPGLSAPVHMVWVPEHPPAAMDYRMATVRGPCPPT
jgi:hypothetical protein